ncbi:MAG: signal peptide peptidase SppA [Bacteroidota bacterium]
MKILFGSCLGSLLAVVVLFFAFGSFFAGLAGKVAEDRPSVETNSILTLDLDDGITELTGNSEFDQFSGFTASSMDEVLGIHDLIRVIEEAKVDDNIKGIYLDQQSVSAPLTKLRQLHRALLDFKESGKFVVAFAPVMTQSAYYLATAADEVYLGPLGIIDFRGLGAEIPYYKKALDKAGIKMEVFKVGDYKSAVEPYLREKMSPENREQTKIFLESLFGEMLEDMAAGRDMDKAAMRRAADDMKGWQKDEVIVASGLIDGIMKRNEIDEKLHDLVGFDHDRELNTIGSSDYFSARLNKLKNGGSNEIAVLMAEGTIVDGKGAAGSIGDRKYVEEIDKLRRDDDVKAVVFRVSSGGGSASSSENIWYAVEQLKDAGKPVIVSMGDYAASGGYYISAGADKIIAEPTTITGSIGVFSTFPVVKELMSDKVGVNFDTVNTARNSTALSTFQDMTPEQKNVLQRRTEATYQVFVDRVAEGRDLSDATVKKLAGGRVYSGTDALDLGLVDELGDLDKAIEMAAEAAGLDDYGVAHYPKLKDPFQRFLEELIGEELPTVAVSNAVMREQLGDEIYEQYMLLRQLKEMQGPQARLPLVVKF